MEQAQGQVNIDLNDWGGRPFPVELRRRVADNLGVIFTRPDAYIDALDRWAPRVVFVLAPVFALILCLFRFWRRAF